MRAGKAARARLGWDVFAPSAAVPCRRGTPTSGMAALPVLRCSYRCRSTRIGRRTSHRATPRTTRLTHPTELRRVTTRTLVFEFTCSALFTLYNDRLWFVLAPFRWPHHWQVCRSPFRLQLAKLTARYAAVPFKERFPVFDRARLPTAAKVRHHKLNFRWRPSPPLG